MHSPPGLGITVAGRSNRPACPETPYAARCARAFADTRGYPRKCDVKRAPCALGLSSPLGSPLRRLKGFGDVDRLSRDPVVAQLDDADPEVRRAAVIGNCELGDPDVISAPHTLEIERCVGRVAAPPLAEVLDPDEALAGLRELEHRVLRVHLVSPIGLAARVVEMLLQHRLDRCRIHATC